MRRRQVVARTSRSSAQRAGYFCSAGQRAVCQSPHERSASGSPPIRHAAPRTRDDLQETIALLKQQKLEAALQLNNFGDES